MRLAIRERDGHVATFDLGDGPVLIGRDPACDVVLDDERVSRQHASVERVEGAGWLLRDLDSGNGTWVDGRRVHAPVLLQGGEEISVGGAVLGIEARSAPGPAPAGRRGLAIAVALVVVVGLAGAGIGAVLARESVPGFPTDTAALRVGTFTPAAAATSTPGPAEAALLALIPGWQQEAGCWRPAPPLADLHRAVAAVGCLGETATVSYWRFDSPEAMTAWYDSVLDAVDLAPGSGLCEEQPPAEQAWAVAGEAGGRLACTEVDGRSVLAWTSDEHLVGAMLSLNRPGGASYADVYGTWLRSGPVDAAQP